MPSRFMALALASIANVKEGVTCPTLAASFIVL